MFLQMCEKRVCAQDNVDDLLSIELRLKFVLSLFGRRGTQPRTLPGLHDCGICVLDVVLYSPCLLVRHCFQLLADDRLLKVDKGDGLRRHFAGLGLLPAATFSSIGSGGSGCGGSRFGIGWSGGLGVSRRDGLCVGGGVGLGVSGGVGLGVGSFRVRNRGRIIRLGLIEKWTKEGNGGCVTRLIQLILGFDFLRQSRTFLVIQGRVSLRRLQGDRSSVGLAGKVENVSCIVSPDSVARMVTKPIAKLLKEGIRDRRG